MPSSTVTTTTTTTTTSNSNQLNLFPLHPENLVEEKEAHDENMAYLFSAADGGATTLTGLLGSSTKPSFNQVDDKNNNSDSSTTTLLSPSASLTYAYAGRQEEEDSRDQEVALVRTALRNKEREPSEERWVRYSEVVERRDDQEVSSCAVPDLRRGNQGLSLKLDYKEILTAWSDKGPLFLHAACAASSPQSPQTVPDIHHDFLFASQLPNRMIKDGWPNNDGGGLWRVPEFTKSQGNEQGPDSVKVKIEEQQEEQGAAAAVVVVGGGDQWKVGQREASVKRYKEKRLNRLFSKRIRYQVRKLNAEKRPSYQGSICEEELKMQ